MISQTIRLDFIRDNNVRIFGVKYDNMSRILNVELYVDGALYAPTAEESGALYVTFVDKQVTKVTAVKQARGYQVTLPERCFEVPGKAVARFVLIAGDKQLGTADFVLMIDPHPSSDIALLETEYGEIREAIRGIEALIADEGAIRADIVLKHGETLEAKTAAEAAAQAVQPWKPSVSSSGDLSWAQSTDLTPPTAQNIKGPKGDPGTTLWSGITGKPATFPPATHDHDSAYLGKTAKAADSAKADAVPWGGITGKPTTFPPATHNHDSAYAAVSHNHDALYQSINFLQTYMPTTPGGTGASIQFWKGTQAQYDALPSKDSSVFYIIIED